jgi:3-oxoacyl-[acyl-carrier protein] reductase
MHREEGSVIYLDGKVVLVTGGSRGIGAATVRSVAAVGARVVLHFSTAEERALAVAESVGGEKCCRVVRSGFEDPAAPGVFWRQALAAFGQVDVLVNNAAVFEPALPEADATAWRDAWQRTIQVNLIAAAELCREAILHFRGRGGGIIINVASRAAFRGGAADYMNYAASKGGLISLTRTIARGYAGEGVVAYAIAPGFTATELNDEFFKTNSRTDLVKDIPLGDIAPPEEIGNIIAFLASGLARHATGSTIDVNGASYIR